MANIIGITTISDPGRGSLAIVEKVLPFQVRRVYFIHEVPPGVVRGGHRHRITRQALLCLNGSCGVVVENRSGRSEYRLDSPSACLLLEPEDWHTMGDFSAGAVLAVFASEEFDPEDYIDDRV
jgi:hypothetical protein